MFNTKKNTLISTKIKQNNSTVHCPISKWKKILNSAKFYIKKE